MIQLSKLAAACGGLLIVTVCIGLFTAPRTMAQNGQTGKDVRVVNSTAEAVPVKVTQLPAVQIEGAPTVNVGSLPAVQVGNGAGNPVPVSVTNLPGSPSSGEPVNVSGRLRLGESEYFGNAVTYTVPEGKVLHVEQVTFLFFDSIGNPENHSTASLIAPAFGPDRTAYYLSVDERLYVNGGSMKEFGTKSLSLRFGPGTQIGFEVGRYFNGTQLSASWTLSGLLTDAG